MNYHENSNDFFNVANFKGMIIGKKLLTSFTDDHWPFMSGSCHLDRASNVKIGVESQTSVIVIFLNCSRVLQLGAHSSYYKGALTQKRSFLVICFTFRSDFHVG